LQEVDARPSNAINLAVRVAAPILLEERLLEEYGLGALRLVQKLEQEFLDAAHGEWKSLSLELYLAQQFMRRMTPPQR
jgi:bifunctional DNase/RNase